MKLKEIIRLVWINLIQNKFQAVLTSIGIIVGAATIVMVIAIGRGGQMDVADQFKNLNAGAIDISYEQADDSAKGGFEQKQSGGDGMANSGSAMSSPNGGGGNSDRSGSAGSSGNNSSGGGMPPDMQNNSGESGGKEPGEMGENDPFGRINQEKITLSEEDVDDLETFLPGISEITISYSTKSDVEGGELEESTSYTIGGVKPNYREMSNLQMAAGEFITDSEEENKEKICILGYTVAKEIFGSVEEAYDSTLYIDGRSYVVNGVLAEMGSVSSGISPDETVFIPYSTGMKYIAGTDVSPKITVIAEDVEEVDTVMENIQTVLSESYPNTEFTITDAGSKMEAASESNRTLTALLIAMAAIAFIVGGIGIMNVLFVSVQERTKEIGILKAVGCSKRDILIEFLLEACCISILGGVLGVLLSVGITPVAEYWKVRVEWSAAGAGAAVIFAIFTGTVFGFYPAWKASRLVPVEALNEE